MSEVSEISRLVERAIDAEKGSPFGIVNLAALAVVAIAAASHTFFVLVIWLVRELGQAVLYVIDLIARFYYARNDLIWVPRDPVANRIPTSTFHKAFFWVVFIAVFCPLGLIVSGEG